MLVQCAPHSSIRYAYGDSTYGSVPSCEERTTPSSTTSVLTRITLWSVDLINGEFAPLRPHAGGIGFGKQSTTAISRGCGLPRKAGRLREESNIAPSVLVSAKACFHRSQGYRPLLFYTSRKRPHPPCVDGESGGWLDDAMSNKRDPIHLVWMVNQVVG
jgi:hypothetical protein